MCGIAGTLAPDAALPADADTAARLAEALAHRGPDDAGLRVDGPAALAHRRLAIVDLSSAARQPFASEDGRVLAIVNGEIYNHRALRRELEARGHRFVSRCDGEVVVHLYEELGEQVVERLDGMFALALWDGRARRLLLARDRFGKKPLYFARGPFGFRFASELQAMCALPDGPSAIDPAALDLYLALQYVPAPETIFREVQKLPAGHLLVVEPGGAPRLRRYFRLSFAERLLAPEPVLARELRRRLEAAVRARLQADVPLGAFLSGGIDSSTVVALLARASSGPVHTFHVVFEGDPSPERPFARLVADTFGTEHEEVMVRADPERDLPELARRYGEPYADPSALPTYYLARAARRTVTVALSGDGADELFGGYRRYAYAQVGDVLMRAPAAMRRLLSRGGRFFEALSGDEATRYLALVGFATPAERSAIHVGAAPDAAAQRFAAILAESDARDGLGRLQDLDVQTYLADCILPKVDIAAMAHALEVRAPFLDLEVAGFAAALPAQVKLRRGVGKVLLRRAMADLLPKAVLRRGKRGFDPPLARWLRGPLRPILGRALEALGARAPFRAEGLRSLLAAHDAGRGHANLLYALLMLELWFERVVDARGAAMGGGVRWAVAR